MGNLTLTAVPVLIGAVWLGLAAGTLAHLSQMSGALEVLHAAETASRTSLTVPSLSRHR
jgi:hypothetical protein